MQRCCALVAFGKFISAPCVINNWAVSVALFHAAQCSGVWPTVSLAQILASCVSNSWAVSVAFFAAAQCSGVASSLFLVLTFGSLCQ